MSTRAVGSLSILLGLCVTACPESKTDTAPEPKSPAVSASGEGAATGAKADEGGEKKEEEGGW
jgi:hypothetical protein